ncbi:Os06g0329200, partial [Oryza sativa Japonica Group]
RSIRRCLVSFGSIRYGRGPGFARRGSLLPWFLNLFISTAKVFRGGSSRADPPIFPSLSGSTRSCLLCLVLLSYLLRPCCPTAFAGLFVRGSL